MLNHDHANAHKTSVKKAFLTWASSSYKHLQTRNDCLAHGTEAVPGLHACGANLCQAKDRRVIS